MPPTIADLWNELLHLMPEEERGFSNEPATESEIEKLETTIGAKLPDEFRELLQATNGNSRDCSSDHHLYPPLLTVEQLILTHQDTLDEINPENTIETMEFSYEWMRGILLFADEDGAGFVLELANGHVWSWDHDGWFFTKKADSIRELLEKTIDDREFWSL